MGMKDFEQSHLLPTEGLGRWYVPAHKAALWLFGCGLAVLCGFAGFHTARDSGVGWILITIAVVIGLGNAGCLFFFVLGGTPAARFGFWFGVTLGGLAILAIPSMMCGI